MSIVWMGWLGAALISGGAAATVWLLLTDALSAPRQLWMRYEHWLERSFRELFLELRGPRVARIQLALLATSVILAVVLGNLLFIVLAIVVGAGPTLWVGARRRERTNAIEGQLEAWLQLVASALEASPSVGAAIQSTVTLVPSPLRQEIDLVIKKMSLGAPLERALMEMSSRCDSQTISGALATIVIGQRTGGRVAALLRDAAGALREMARLEGFVRSKTAEGRTQAFVLALAPIAFVAGLRSLKEDWFSPLVESSTGFFLIGAAVALWIVAVALARRILNIED